MQRALCVTIALAMLSPACAQEQAMRIHCEMSIAKSQPSSQPVELTFALTNAGDDVLQVLTWQTPFEGIRSAMFTVTRDGTEVEYRGPMLKRAAPRKEQYLSLKPGERREAKINLAEAWDVEPVGSYTIEYSAQLFDVIEGTTAAPRSLDELNPVTINCKPVTFTRVR
jgi:peptidyl-Lys metalloendopeptidase